MDVGEKGDKTREISLLQFFGWCGLGRRGIFDGERAASGAVVVHMVQRTIAWSLGGLY